MTTRRKPSKVLTKILASIDKDTLRRTRDRMLIAGKITDTLKAKNISQKKFAEMLGKSESEISEWLSGNRNFTINTLSDIYNCLGIDFLQLFYLPTMRVSKEDAEFKISKTRNPIVYDMKGVRLVTKSFRKWQVYPSSERLSLTL
jgi:transcriptional regulator with XRE-family HTH domain